MGLYILEAGGHDHELHEFDVHDLMMFALRGTVSAQVFVQTSYLTSTYIYDPISRHDLGMQNVKCAFSINWRILEWSSYIELGTGLAVV